ncbi:hypothetical protein EDC32_10838 [Laceyella sacchari]|uniref:hypothetical protein n=1 Tax=Laceyella sacchari TaxID=37482 RepID=UPI000AF467CB|nr:hypothetical protein [Laceyella sacchari]TCW35326.1 hypothetical protein EDC32_10838 [Laceyella sacchari]
MNALNLFKLAEAIRFNESLPIPVKWKRATTVTGISKRTGGLIGGKIGHILLMEDWGGRTRGEFLCGAEIKNPFAHQMLNMSERDVEASKRERVTCKKCLAVAERMKNNGAA